MVSLVRLLKLVRWIVWSLVFVLGGLSAATFLGWWQIDGPGAPKMEQETQAEATPAPGIGGPFAMTSHRGQPFTQQDLGGRPSLMFFGFTYCPDICPTTLASMTSWLRDLGPGADRLNAIFVSVDPGRDTPAAMASYLESFDPRITGLTGTPQQLADMARTYRFSYRKVAQAGDDYTMDHTAMVYLLDSQGRFFSAIDFHENDETAMAKIRRLLATPTGS